MLTFFLELFKYHVMEKEKLGLSAWRRNFDALGIGSFLIDEVGRSVSRVIRPPKKEITEDAKKILDNALEELDAYVDFPGYIKILSTIEDVYQTVEEGNSNGEVNVWDLSSENFIVNIHFWLQILRDKSLGKFGTKLTFSNTKSVHLSPIPDNSIEWIIGQRSENLNVLEEEFLAWVETYNIREILQKGSLLIISNHDQWSTQPISLYFFQKFLRVVPEQSATVVGRRVLTFRKFKFDPEQLIRGQGHVLITDPPTRNGRHKAFGYDAMQERKNEYIEEFKTFLSFPGNIITSAPGGTRDRYTETEEGRVLHPAQPVSKALDLLEEMQIDTTIIPVAFHHGEGFHLEKMREKIDLQMQWGEPILQGSELSGEEIWNRVLNILPNPREKSPQQPDNISQ